jgi:prepilin-type N-terminal cleavage/methylation domain-containing protein
MGKQTADYGMVSYILSKKVSEKIRQSGFTIVEMAIVMVIIGLLVGGGVKMITVLTQKKYRTENRHYLALVKESLLAYGQANGVLPWADVNNDGNSDAGQGRGMLPYLTLGIQPVDGYSRVAGYGVNVNLGSNHSSSCSSLKTGLTGFPRVVDTGAGGTAFSVAAVIISSGERDADGAGSVFDIASGGNNVTGTPNYLVSTPTPTFDDMGTYIGGWELYSQMCARVPFTVENTTGSTAYVRDLDGGVDLGSVAAATTQTMRLSAGSRVEFRDGVNGSGNVLNSAPASPITVGNQAVSVQLTP